MTDRDLILAAVRRNAPPPTPLPDTPAFPQGDGDLSAQFVASAQSVGASVLEAEEGGVDAVLRAAYPEAVRIVSETTGRMVSTAELGGDARAFAELDLFVAEGAFGVAENGAVWLPETNLGHRVAPFLAPHVALVLNRADIVATMHEAYERLGDESDGFGVFVAGPSKTADIEQSLVIGAHGPLSLTVVLMQASR